MREFKGFIIYESDYYWIIKSVKMFYVEDSQLYYLKREYETPEKFITEAISHFGRKKNGCLYIWNKGAC